MSLPCATSSIQSGRTATGPSPTTLKFDGVDIESRIEVKRSRSTLPCGRSRKNLSLIEFAADRIEDFHRKQVRNSWFTTSADGTLLGTRITRLRGPVSTFQAARHLTRQRSS